MGEVKVGHGLKPIGTGTFSPSAAASTSVSDTYITANCEVMIVPTNGQAGELLRSKSCYVSAVAAGSFKFIVSASGAGAPGADETFSYFYFSNS